MMASTDTGVTMASGAPVAPSHAVGGGIGARGLRLLRPLVGRIGTADRRRVTGLSR
jgi:hypothetical protein